MGSALVATTFASSASARVEELRWQHPDPNSVSEFRLQFGSSPGSYDVDVSVGVPQPDASGIYRHNLVVSDEQPVHAVMVAVGLTGLPSSASNEIFRAGLPPAPVPPPPPPEEEPTPSEETPPPDPTPTPGPVEPPPPSATGQGLYRINVGGPEFVDRYNQVWEIGEKYRGPGLGGSTPSANGPNVADTDLPELYWRERTLWKPGASMSFELPIEPGEYLVRLHFAETPTQTAGFGAYGPGQRQFDVRAEGAVVLEALDIANEVGPETALVKELVVAVSDGALSLGFDHIGVGEPRIAAIEVDPSQGPLPPAILTSLYRVNVGGPGFVDPDGRLWREGFNFRGPGPGGSIQAAPGPDVADTDSPELYWHERTLWKLGTSLTYEFPVLPGEYVIRLHFAETAGYGPGERLFDVGVEGDVIFEDLDIALEVGQDRALVSEIVTSVTDGSVSLSFDHIGAGEPRISAIEVLRQD